MEGDNSILRYLEKLVRANSKQDISGAFRAFIQFEEVRCPAWGIYCRFEM